MARRAQADTRYLEQKNGQWRVTVAVPRHLQASLGTRLKRPLRTDSLAVANQLKWPIVAELRRMIEDAGRGKAKDPLVIEAAEFAALRANAYDEHALDNLDMGIEMKTEELRGDPVDTVEGPDGGPLYLYDPLRERRASQYLRIATGDAVPLALYHEDYLRLAKTKRRTKEDDRRALKFLEAWCSDKHIEPTLQAITPKLAARFIDDLPEVTGLHSDATLNKYHGRLSAYWKWLKKRHHVHENVWAGLRREVAHTPPDERERAFTEEEMRKLFAGPASPSLRDVMMIAALSGARLDAIVDLKVGPCREGVFRFKPQKKETDFRLVPVHTALSELVQRRVAGKADDEDLFPEWPAPKKAGSQRERSFKTSNAFTAYRRAVGVDDRVSGRRRGRVNFHSFRRWFITQAERAGQPQHIIEFVVGHKRKGMSLGGYSEGPTIEQQMRACVEAVQVPR